ncbi:CDP-alcohol phosphatidyltransferase class-I family protein [Neomegalonema perideroedes]|uniref:CDP-alcohol phosphatidyltransferase family protein n=1 Tax=Neomegalonema perideroedes TaxID=217219 RepID=UPI00037A9764|nr:CDP-alcohol phosphatidyltransferase family protein [Neomegalonema perideroedes]
MLEQRLRTLVDPFMARMGRRAALLGARADSVTWAGFGCMVAAAALIAAGWSWLALIPLLAAGFLGGLDGAVARATIGTDRGAFLNDSLNAAGPALAILGFGIQVPAAHGVAAAALLAAWGIWSATTLAYDLHAARRAADRAGFRGEAEPWPTRRLERWAAFAALGLLCLLPGVFPWLAGLLVFIALAAVVARFNEGLERL